MWAPHRSREEVTPANYRSQSYRGYCQRGLLTLDVRGQIEVPRISCVCGGMVDFEFVHLVPYGRLWFDVEERARELAGLCLSYQHRPWAPYWFWASSSAGGELGREGPLAT